MRMDGMSTKSNRRNRNVLSGVKNYAPVRPCSESKTFGKDAQKMMDYFAKMMVENPGFFYTLQLDDGNRLANVFWADARSRAAYADFGDVVTLDSSGRVSQYKVTFATFTGVNHHGDRILFGCALLLDNSEASFVWLLETFLMLRDCPPVSIVTNQDRAIQSAVSQVLPKTRHCVCKWHVLREGQESVAHVCVVHPNFREELYKCINLTKTIEEFELLWALIVDKYDLGENDWLQSIYDSRKKWVPAYFRDSFFADVLPDQEANCSFLMGNVNNQTTLPMLFRQYERAMEYWYEREADHDTNSKTPVLRTPSPMEKQAAELYTRKIFGKFQEELIETFAHTANRIDDDGATSSYEVEHFLDGSTYTVYFNISDLRATCSCQMFEYSGILCRHILTVFTVNNVLTLPSHYILKRWTKNAKIVNALDELDGVIGVHAQESMVSRYNILSREAIRYAQEGATTLEGSYAAVTALQDGRRNIDLAKKNVANIDTQTPRVGATGYDDYKCSGCDTPLLWPQHDEVARRFNLNDSAIQPHPVSGMSLLRMGPTSLQCDDGPSDSMVVLPCLKSMTWVMEDKNTIPASRVAVINLKLQHYSKGPVTESEVKFQLSRITLEPMLKSVAYITEQLSTSANRVAVINLKLQDTETSTGESEIKFQVSRDTLGALLKSMAYIREQLTVLVEQQTNPLSKKQRK